MAKQPTSREKYLMEIGGFTKREDMIDFLNRPLDPAVKHRIVPAALEDEVDPEDLVEDEKEEEPTPNS